MRNRHTKINKGFTLIETLVAIAVLMIAIAGPLTVANKALMAALYARDQSIASYLALETMEIVRDIKNNNPSSGFLNNLGGGTSCLLDNGKCDYGTVSGTRGSLQTTCASSIGCQIYLDNAAGYNNQSTGNSTVFYRYFYLTATNNPADPNDYTLTVVVTWKEGTVTNEIRMRAELINIRQA